MLPLRYKQIAAVLMLCAVSGAPADLKVTATFLDEPTGTMHYASTVTVAFGDASSLILEGEMLSTPGPHFQLSASRFLLLGWTSPGSGMEAMHALLISVRAAVFSSTMK